MEESKPSKGNTASKAATSQAPKAPPLKAKTIQRGEAEFQMHLFEARPAEALKNRSFRRGEIDLTKWPHKHFYRSRNERGIQTKYTTTHCGHFHEVTTHDKDGNPLVGKDGFPRIECGPPLKKVEFRVAGELRDKIVRVFFEREVVDETDDMDPKVKSEKVVDNHTHEFNYEGTETFTTKGFADLRRENAKSVREEIMESGGQAIPTGPAPLTGKDGVNIT